MTPGQERYVLSQTGTGEVLRLPGQFRPARNSPQLPPLTPVRAYGYPDVYANDNDDGYEAPEEAVVELVGKIRAATETALMSVLGDWKRFVLACDHYGREITPGVFRREWALQRGELFWAHPDGLPSNFADVRIRLIRPLVDATNTLDPAG